MTAKRTFKKIIGLTLAGASVAASRTMFSACTTHHPEVEIKISFNDVSYTLEYKLYRKLAPSTVQHFLELAEKGYYDGLCVHNYVADSKMYTGAYSYDPNKTSEGGLVEKAYYDVVRDWNLTQTVWRDKEVSLPLYSVYGEFSDNGFEVENGELRQTYGSLTMYYTPKKNTPYVYVKRADGKGYDPKKYEYNSATSQFFISLASGSSSNSAYCTFGTLKDDSVEVLDDLKDAISTNIEGEYEGETSDFAPETTLIVDEDDPIESVSSAKESQTYSVPKEPIVITSVKVLRY